MNEITQETRVLQLKGGVNIYITPEEEEKIKGFIQADLNFFMVRGRLIMRDSVLYIVSAADVEEAMMIKRGYVKCEKGHWYQRNLAKCDKCYY